MTSAARTTFTGRAEAEYLPRASNKITQRDGEAIDRSFDKQNIRKLELAIKSNNHGTLWLGQGSMATDGISEIDLAGTSVIGYASVSDTAAGFLFRETGGDLSDVAVGDAFSDLDGGRRLRVRYDTPRIAGFSFAGAYGTDVIIKGNSDVYGDLALRYAEKLLGVEVMAGAGYNRIMPQDGRDTETWSTSGSALHVATGLSITLSGGSRVQGDGNYGYAKLGWLADIWSSGTTAFAVDCYTGDNFATGNSESESYSIMAVQNIDKVDMEVYAIYRIYAYDDTAASYRDGAAFMSGFRWKF